jgi:hypothetical protein
MELLRLHLAQQLGDPLLLGDERRRRTAVRTGCAFAGGPGAPGRFR